MIEAIKAYTGAERAEGQIKMTVQCLYRCTVCGTIKFELTEIKKHECKKNENRSM